MHAKDNITYATVHFEYSVTYLWVFMSTENKEQTVHLYYNNKFKHHQVYVSVLGLYDIYS